MSCRLRHRLVQFLGYPVFIRHEETGLTALYINRLLTRRVVDCSDDDGRELCRASSIIPNDPKFSISIVGRGAYSSPGTIAAPIMPAPIWGGGKRRLLHRTTVEGISRN